MLLYKLCITVELFFQGFFRISFQCYFNGYNIKRKICKNALGFKNKVVSSFLKFMLKTTLTSKAFTNATCVLFVMNLPYVLFCCTYIVHKQQQTVSFLYYM